MGARRQTEVSSTPQPNASLACTLHATPDELPAPVRIVDRISISIVESDRGTSSLLTRLLERAGEYQCLGCCKTATEACSRIPVESPKIVLIEVRLPDGSGIECARTLIHRMPSLRVVILGSVTDGTQLNQALDAGASGWLVRPFHRDQCLATLRFSRVAHTPSLSPVTYDRTSGQAVTVQAHSPGCLLNSRENEVMEYLTNGFLYKEIADRMHSSIAVVRKKAHSIYLKLHVNNRTEAIRKFTARIAL